MSTEEQKLPNGMVRGAGAAAKAASAGGPIARALAIASLFKQAALEWNRDNALRLSAAVSFYAVLSLAPLLAIVIQVMGVAHAKRFARTEMLQQATNLMGTQAASAIKPIIEGNATHRMNNLATVISAVVLLFSATGVFVELKGSLNTIWDAELQPNKMSRTKHVILTFIRVRLLSLAMVFGAGFLLVCSMFLSGIFTAFQQHVAGDGRWTSFLGGILLAGGVEFALFAFLFRFLPDTDLKWRDVWHGALIAAVLFSVGRYGLAVYFSYSRIDNMYGAAGSLVAILTWIYYSSFSLFFGAEFTKVWTRRGGGSPGTR